MRCHYHDIKLSWPSSALFNSPITSKIALSDRVNIILSCWEQNKRPGEQEGGQGEKKKNSSPPCGPQSIHCSRLISFGCIILSVSIANLTVPKAQAPDWSIQNQTTNYWALHTLLYALLPSSTLFSSPSFLPLSSSCGVHVHKSSSQAVLGFHFPDLP